MALAMKKAAVAARPTTRSSPKVVCQAGITERVQAAAASALVATLLVSAPAQAGVVIVQPELKKVFQDNAAAAANPANAAARAAKLKSIESFKPVDAPKVKAEPKESSSSGFNIDPRVVALPGALILVGGGLAAAYKLDAGWGAFFANAMVRDSNDFVGYEPELKPEGGYVGTRRVKASTPKKSFFSGFGKK